jgi:hypothetical protein
MKRFPQMNEHSTLGITIPTVTGATSPDFRLAGQKSRAALR